MPDSLKNASSCSSVSSVDLTVLPPHWKLQQFETRLAAMEVQTLVGRPAEQTEQGIRLLGVDAAVDDLLAGRLSFARALVCGGRVVPTQQHRLELLAGGGRRKITSHALHGLHPYKGKFYPQLARSLLNIADLSPGSVVLDPFAGCGTTLLEASMLGLRGVGLDLNPMAVLVANTKLELLQIGADQLRRELVFLEARSSNVELADERYLAKWFPPENFSFLRDVLSALRHSSSPLGTRAVQVVLSSVLRSGSYQDPKQLRVGRRKGSTPLLAPLFWRALDDLLTELSQLERAGIAPAVRSSGSMALDGDARDAVALLRQAEIDHVDAVITSPPYASALPYIDTDRLSLRAFGLLDGASQRSLESRLIGNREISDRERAVLETEFSMGAVPNWVPDVLRGVLERTSQAAAEPASGFRKRRTPSLLYAYFRDMRLVIAQIAALLPASRPFVVVVGDNTVAGPRGSVERIPTADLYIALAAQFGFILTHDFSKRLTSYGAPETVHQRNAMSAERVLVFSAPGMPTLEARETPA